MSAGPRRGPVGRPHVVVLVLHLRVAAAARRTASCHGLFRGVVRERGVSLPLGGVVACVAVAAVVLAVLFFLREVERHDDGSNRKATVVEARTGEAYARAAPGLAAGLRFLRRPACAWACVAHV